MKFLCYFFRVKNMWLNRWRCLPQPVSNDHDGAPSKQIKITTANSVLQSRVRAASWQPARTHILTKSTETHAHTCPVCFLFEIKLFLLSLYFLQPGTVGSAFSMSAPITKVFKNDAYTAPRPPVPVAPTRPNTSMAASRASAAALQPVSRTLQQSPAETSKPPPAPPQVNTSYYYSVWCIFTLFVLANGWVVVLRFINLMSNRNCCFNHFVDKLLF